MKRTGSGSTASNPIVIQDPPDSSGLIHLPPEQPVLGKTSFTNDIQLPRPSRKAIIATLVKMPDVTRVVEELVKLSSSPRTYQTPSFRDAITNSNPKKKRKLNEVPAGAADWDVPFPFEYGHGPEQYVATWVEERRKALIGQLVALISTATKKAAAKAYYRKHGTNAFAALVSKSSKLASNGETLSDVLADTSNCATPTHSSPATPAREHVDGQTSGNTGLDDLLSSLLATVPSSSFPSQLSADGFFADEGISFNEVDFLSSTEGITDGWLSIFQSFSTPDGGVLGGPSTIPPLTLESANTPTPDSLLLPPPEAPMRSATPTGSLPSPFLLPDTIPYQFPPLDSMPPGEILKSNIDPLLLPFSVPPFSNEVPPLNASPFPSQSSLGPSTPQSSAWELGDVFVPDSIPTQPAPDSGYITADPAEDTAAAVRSVLQPKPAQSNGTQPTATGGNSRSSLGPKRESRRAAIIQTAKERKRQLEVELERAKIEYWEMAIEQSAMLHLLQKL